MSAAAVKSSGDSAAFPISAVQPRNDTQALDFIKSTGFNGDAVVVAVFDTGVDPGTVGLQVRLIPFL